MGSFSLIQLSILPFLLAGLLPVYWLFRAKRYGWAVAAWFTNPVGPWVIWWWLDREPTAAARLRPAWRAPPHHRIARDSIFSEPVPDTSRRRYRAAAMDPVPPVWIAAGLVAAAAVLLAGLFAFEASDPARAIVYGHGLRPILVVLAAALLLPVAAGCAGRFGVAPWRALALVVFAAALCLAVLGMVTNEALRFGLVAATLALAASAAVFAQAWAGTGVAPRAVIFGIIVAAPTAGRLGPAVFSDSVEPVDLLLFTSLPIGSIALLALLLLPASAGPPANMAAARTAAWTGDRGYLALLFAAVVAGLVTAVVGGDVVRRLFQELGGAEAATVANAYGLALAVGALTGGLLCDGWAGDDPRRRVVAAATALAAAAVAGIADPLLPMAAGAVAMIFAGGAALPVLFALIQQHVPPAKRALAAALPIAGTLLLRPVGGGYLADSMADDSAMLVSAAAALLLGAAAVLLGAGPALAGARRPADLG